MRDLKKFEPSVSKQFRFRIRKVVKTVADDAKGRAPRLSGKLAKGISPSVTNTGARLVSKAPHARIHEFGGRHPVFGHTDRWVYQPARPHIFPAVRAGREEVNREALAALDDAIEEIGFK
jgi:phage gpG-like protein